MKKRAGLASVGLVMAAGVFVARPAPDRRPTAAARLGPFAQTLVERGTIGAARVMLYGSTIAGVQAKILEIVPEGRAVTDGDVLIRFDPAPFEAGVERETAALAQADADLIRAREDLRLEQMRADADAAAARDQLAFAEMALASERDGKVPVALAEAEASANLASRELDRTTAAVADVRALLKDGFATRAELDRAEQALREADDRKRVAALRLAALRTLEQPALLEKARADVTSASKGLAASHQAGDSRLAQRRAAVAFAESRTQEAAARLAHAHEQVERTVVRATTSGLVVYRELFFGTDKRKPQPGDEVWPNQPLVAMPDPAQLTVETRVRETDLHLVAGSTRVDVAVDAYPGLSLSGSVDFVGALAQEDSARAGSKFFPVTIRLAAADPRLRAGMSARVTLEVSAAPSVVLIPRDAVVEDDAGQPRCYVISGSRSIARAVRLAGRNETVAAIAEGLAPGERVLLAER
jgi:RND family efflux transporter MFP subunit